MHRLPGLLLCVAVAALARGISSALGLDATLIAILLGTLLAPVAARVALLRSGVSAGTRLLLPLALALLGFKVDLAVLARLEWTTLLIVALSMAITISLCVRLSNRLHASSSLGILIGVGTSVCGGSAIVAVAPVTRANESDIAVSIATVSLFGTLFMLAMPPLGHALRLSQLNFGSWAGGTLHLVPQAVAAGFAYGELAGQIATVVKMGRVLLLAPVVLIVAALERRRASQKQAARSLFSYVPPFILGYLATLALSSVALLPEAVSGLGARLSSELLLAGMAGVGLGTDFSALRRAQSAALQLGALASLLLALSILLMLSLFTI